MFPLLSLTDTVTKSPDPIGKDVPKSPTESVDSIALKIMHLDMSYSVNLNAMQNLNNRVAQFISTFEHPMSQSNIIEVVESQVTSIMQYKWEIAMQTLSNVKFLMEAQELLRLLPSPPKIEEMPEKTNPNPQSVMDSMKKEIIAKGMVLNSQLAQLVDRENWLILPV